MGGFSVQQTVVIFPTDFTLTGSEQLKKFWFRHLSEHWEQKVDRIRRSKLSGLSCRSEQ